MIGELNAYNHVHRWWRQNQTTARIIEKIIYKISERSVAPKQKHYSNNVPASKHVFMWWKKKMQKSTHTHKHAHNKRPIDVLLLFLRSTVSKLRIIVCVIAIFFCGLFGSDQGRKDLVTRYFYGFRFCVLKRRKKKNIKLFLLLIRRSDQLCIRLNSPLCVSEWVCLWAVGILSQYETWDCISSNKIYQLDVRWDCNIITQDNGWARMQVKKSVENLFF